MSGGVCLLLFTLAVSSTGCGAAGYRLEFVNDLPQTVAVEGCKSCAGGREVDPGQSLPLTVEQDVIIKVMMADGTVVGCAYQPAGASSSDPLPIKAADFEHLLCDAPSGEER